MAELLRAVVSTAFQGSQSSSTSYLVISQNLKEHHEHAISNGFAADFQQCFVQCMSRILSAQRKDQCATRVLEFVAEYFRTVCPAEEDLDDSDYVDFAEDVIAYFLRGFEARLAGVRYWCVLIVGNLLPLIAINEDLLLSIRDKAVLRLRDSDARVRVQAVILVARFDLEPETVEPLERTLQHDPSSEVRLAVSYNLAHGGKRLAECVCERVRDESPVIRRAVYAKVLRSIDFRVLGLRTRENVVRSGLVDRDPAVRKAAAELVAHFWVATADNNIELVLQRLDVLTNQEVADLALEAFFDVRRDVLDEKLVFDEEFWDNLWIEDVVLLRNFQGYCLKHGMNELLDERMPDLAALAGHIQRLWTQFQDPETYMGQTDEQAEDIRDGVPFMVEQLLLVVAQYDFRDEASRRKVTEVLNEIVMAAQPASDRIIQHIVAIQQALNQSDMALMSWAFETLEAISDLNPTQEQPDQALLASLLRALALFKAVLSRVSSPDLSAYLPTLYSGYLMPALQSPSTDIREPALDCMALACLLDEKFAMEHIGEFMTFLDSVLGNLAPEAIDEADENRVDHENESENEDVTENENETRELQIATNAITDIILVHYRSDLPLEACLMLLRRLISSRNRSLQAVSALNLAKLMLAKLEVSEETLKALTLLNFRGDDGSDSRSAALLQQQLNLFLRAYTLYPEGKLALANIFDDVYGGFVASATSRAQKAQQRSGTSAIGRRSSIIRAPEVLKHGRVSAVDLVSQVMDLTADDVAKPAYAHVKLARSLLQLLISTEDSGTRRSLAAAVNKLMLTPSTPSGELQSILDILDGENWDTPSFTAVVKSALQKFESVVQELTRQATANEEATRETDRMQERAAEAPEQAAESEIAGAVPGAEPDLEGLQHTRDSQKAEPAPAVLDEASEYRIGNVLEAQSADVSASADGSGSWVEVHGADIEMSQHMEID